jgi:hypothetical protein
VCFRVFRPEAEVRFLGDLESGAFTTEPVASADWLRIAELVWELQRPSAGHCGRVRRDGRRAVGYRRGRYARLVPLLCCPTNSHIRLRVTSLIATPPGHPDRPSRGSRTDQSGPQRAFRCPAMPGAISPGGRRERHCSRYSFLSEPPDKFGLMEAQAWTAIGLLAATLVGSLFYIGNRIDSLGARLDSRIDGLSGRIDGLTFRVEDQGRQLGSQIYESWQPSWTSISGVTLADPSALSLMSHRRSRLGQQKSEVRAPVSQLHYGRSAPCAELPRHARCHLTRAAAPPLLTRVRFPAAPLRSAAITPKAEQIRERTLMLLSRSANDGPAGLGDELIPKHDPDRGLCTDRSLDRSGLRGAPPAIRARAPAADRAQVGSGGWWLPCGP